MKIRILLSIIMVLFVHPGWLSAQVPVDDPELPPRSECSYRNRGYQGQDSLDYQDVMGSIVLADPVHRCWSSVVRTNVGPNEMQDFESVFETNVSVFGGGWTEATLFGPVQTIAYNKADITTGTFATEVISLNLSGDVPGYGVFLVRESPSLTSSGQVTITDIGGGLWQIDSFFDIFTELSFDGGMTWLPQINGPTRFDYTIYAPAVTVTSPLLPAHSECDSIYRIYHGHSSFDYNGPIPIVLTDPVLYCWSGISRIDVGPDEHEIFDALMRVGVSIDGNPAVATLLSGPIESLAFNKVGYTTGIFDTEIVSSDLYVDVSGFGSILFRKDPSQTCPGETTIVDLGGGLWEIDSFFDVFTEVSIDGGQSWIQQTNGPTRLYYTTSAQLVLTKDDADSDGVDDVKIEWSGIPGLPHFDVHVGLVPNQLNTLLTTDVAPGPVPPEYSIFHVDALNVTDNYFYKVVPLYHAP